MGETTGQTHSALRIVAACQSSAEFVAVYARYCEGRSLFIATKTPKAVGQIVKFKIALASGEHLMTGVGPVVETFADRENRFNRPGMRVEVEKLDAQGRHWMEQLRHRGTAKNPAVVSAPTGMFSVSDERSVPAKAPAVVSAPTGMFSVTEESIAAAAAAPAPAAAAPPPAVDKPATDASVPVAVKDHLSAGWEMDGLPSALSLPTSHPAAAPLAAKNAEKVVDKKSDKKSDKKAEKNGEKSDRNGERRVEGGQQQSIVVSGEVDVPPPLPPPPTKGRSKRITFPALMFNKPRGLGVPTPTGGVVPKPIALLPASTQRETTGKLRPPTAPIEREPVAPIEREPGAPVAPLGTPADTEPHRMVPSELEASLARPVEPAEGTPPPAAEPAPTEEDTHPEFGHAPPESSDVITSAPESEPKPRRTKASTTTPPPIWAERTVTQTLVALVGGKPDPKVREETVHWTNPGFDALKRPTPPAVDIVEEDIPVTGPTSVPVEVGVELSSGLDRTIVSPPPEAPRSRLRFVAALAVTALAGVGGGYYLGLRQGTTIEKMPTGDIAAAAPADDAAMKTFVAECKELEKSAAQAAPTDDSDEPATPPPAEVAASTPEPPVSRARSREPSPSPSSSQPAASSAASASQSCFMNAMTGPAGATVLVDGRVAGRTPIRAKVACGRHSVRFEMEGYQAATRSINARRGDTEKVTADLSRPRTVLRVESTPPGATVLVNGSSVGVTPLTTTVAGYVSSTVTLSKPGFKTVSKPITPTTTSAKVAATLKADTSLRRPVSRR